MRGCGCLPSSCTRSLNSVALLDPSSTPDHHSSFSPKHILHTEQELKKTPYTHRCSWADRMSDDDDAESLFLSPLVKQVGKERMLEEEVKAGRKSQARGGPEAGVSRGGEGVHQEVVGGGGSSSSG